MTADRDTEEPLDGGWAPTDTVELASEVAAEADAEGMRRQLTEEELAEASQRHWILVGRVAQASAAVELYLRQLMTALLDSKYAGLVAAGLSMSDLIENCLVLAKVNEEISDDQRAEIRDLLTALKPAVVTRNQLIHGLWVPHAGRTEGVEEPPIALTSKRRTGQKAVLISYAEAEQLGQTLNSVGYKIFNWALSILRDQALRRQVFPESQ
ncbi:hypothetical protein ABZZ44_30615 [Streptomyces sp. NPDC006460]|uniref:hypothetical protein n=1 Tax=Streptomyces sp. NPDC006460 TaxID=3154304 RepID=UPI0033B6DCEC